MKYLIIILGLLLTGCNSSDSTTATTVYPLNGVNTAYPVVGWGDTNVVQTATDLVIDVTVSSGGGNLFPNTTDFTTVVLVVNQDNTELNTTIVRISALGSGGEYVINVTIPLVNITGMYVMLSVQADVFEEVVDSDSDWRVLSSYAHMIDIPYTN